MAYRKKEGFFLNKRKSEGNWGCAEGCGNVVNPAGFPSFPCPGARGKRGGDFLFKAPEGPLFGSPFPPFRPQAFPAAADFLFDPFSFGGDHMAMDQQASMDYLRDLYREKNEYLEKFLEPVTPFEFYREIFPVGSFERKGHFEDEKGNGIAVTVPKTAGIALGIEGDGKARRYTITDELSELSEVFDTDFTIMSPLSYFGRRRCGKNARYLYAMVFDLDGVEMPQLRDTLHQMNKDILPQATFVVNSGTGLHLYYVLQEPIPMYPHNQKCLKELKYSLTRQIWNRYTSTIKEPQVQGILQGFRVVGSGSKLGREYPVAAYRLGGRVTIEELLEFIPDSNGEQQQILGLMKKGRLSLVEAKEKYPDWYERRIVKKERRGRWTVKRDLYDWWLHRIEDEIRVGHRFYGIMTEISSHHLRIVLGSRPVSLWQSALRPSGCCCRHSET